jgi:hypothetical protein
MKMKSIFNFRLTAFQAIAALAVLHALPAAALCPQLLALLGQRDQFSDQPTLNAAANAVIRERLAAKRPVPDLGGMPPVGTVQIEHFHDLIKVKERFGTAENPLPTRDASLSGAKVEVTTNSGIVVIRPANSKYREEFNYDIKSVREAPAYDAVVQEVETPKGARYFRPMAGEHGSSKAGRTLAAYVVDQSLKVETVPVSKWAEVNGRLGTISEVADGRAPVLGMKELLAQGKVDPRSAYDCMAAEFLRGNVDGSKRNVRIDGKGRMRVFDHDFAFSTGLSPIKSHVIEDPQDILVGVDLPEFYTKEFAENLAKWTPTKIRGKLEFLITDAEVEGVIFRREILLKDMELRPQSVLP